MNLDKRKYISQEIVTGNGLHYAYGYGNINGNMNNSTIGNILD